MSIRKQQWKKPLAKAQLGNADAQWEVGGFYNEGLLTKTGFRIKQKPKKAVKWFSLAAVR